jgi:ParB family chromosome partitioning protein
MDMSIEMVQLDVESCDENPYQHRISYPEEDVKLFAASIRREGVIQPITVRKHNGRIQVCVGWMRVLACRMAGVKTIPAMVRDLSDLEMARLALAENLVRKNPNVIEQARGFRILHDEFKMTYEEIGSDLGLSKDVVAQRVRLLSFPLELQNLLSRDKISVSNAEVLNRLAAYPEHLKSALENVMSGNLTTQQTTEIVQVILRDIKLDEDIAEYVQSEEYLMFLHTAQLDMRLSDAVKPKACPLCLQTELVESTKEDGGYECPMCGYNSNTYEQPFNDIMRRIRARRLRKQGKFFDWMRYVND